MSRGWIWVQLVKCEAFCKKKEKCPAEGVAGGDGVFEQKFQLQRAAWELDFRAFSFRCSPRSPPVAVSLSSRQRLPRLPPQKQRRQRHPARPKRRSRPSLGPASTPLGGSPLPQQSRVPPATALQQELHGFRRFLCHRRCRHRPCKWVQISNTFMNTLKSFVAMPFSFFVDFLLDLPLCSILYLHFSLCWPLGPWHLSIVPIIRCSRSEHRWSGAQRRCSVGATPPSTLSLSLSLFLSHLGATICWDHFYDWENQAAPQLVFRLDS